MSNIKATMRRAVAQRLKDMSSQTIHEYSESICLNLQSLPKFTLSAGICCYLSMNNEAQTNNIIKSAFRSGKRVFVPKVIGKSPNDMVILEIPNYDAISAFPKTKWGIPEPPGDELLDMSQSGAFDLIVVPGVVFDMHCGRIGHGRGYYDAFLERAFTAAENQGHILPITAGIALDEQIYEEGNVPMDAHDKYLDFVVTPTRIFERHVD